MVTTVPPVNAPASKSIRTSGVVNPVEVPLIGTAYAENDIADTAKQNPKKIDLSDVIAKFLKLRP